MASTSETILIESKRQDEMINVTGHINKFVVDSGVKEGVLYLFVPHTTAAITINENADPDVKKDMLLGLSKTFPNDKDYQHYEGNSHAHIKSSLVGVDQTIIIEKGRLKLGTWQGIYFCEFDGPRTRKLYIKIIKDKV